MSISLKSKKDIEKMNIAGRKAASVLEMLDDHVKPGVTTNPLDEIADTGIVLGCSKSRCYTKWHRHRCAVRQGVCSGCDSR